MTGLRNILSRLLLLCLGIAGLWLTQELSLPLLETVTFAVCSIICIIVALLPGRVRFSWVWDAFDLI